MQSNNYNLQSKFDLEKHNQHYVNYLEVIIDEEGVVHYAVPSHQKKLLEMATKKLNKTEEEIGAMCPIDMYADFMTWLMQITNCVCVWTKFYRGVPNEEQSRVLGLLKIEKRLN